VVAGVAAGVLLAALTGGCAATVTGVPAPAAAPATGPQTGHGGATASQPPAPQGAAQVVPVQCTRAAEALPVRARLAQLLVVGVDPTGPADALSAVRAEQVGGLFIGGTATGLLTGGALGGVQAAARFPVSVAVDEEGGRVQRIDGLDGSIPSARQMAATMSPQAVHELGATRGRELRARGVTVDFAPDADVSAQPAGAVIGDRSFSADPAVVAGYAGAFAAGLREAGVTPVFKHFPGHGHATGDSHRGTATTPPLAALRGNDLLPYHDLLAAGPAEVMVGHLDVPGLTDGLPASISPAAYRLLRTELGFTGVAVTDDLSAMKAISDRYDLPEAVLAALRAGADEALWTTERNRLGEVLDRLQRAVSAGELPGAQVTASAAKVLMTKNGCG
jgi:beta-N-acetylhexosaminidase